MIITMKWNVQGHWSIHFAQQSNNSLLDRMPGVWVRNYVIKEGLGSWYSVDILKKQARFEMSTYMSLTLDYLPPVKLDLIL